MLPNAVVVAGTSLYIIWFCMMMVALWRELTAEFREYVAAPSNELDGRRTFHGKVVAEQCLVAPLSGRACVAWQLQYLQRGRMGWQRYYASDCAKAVPFELNDVAVRLAQSPTFSERFACRAMARGIAGEASRDRVAEAVRALPEHQAMHRRGGWQSYEVREFRVEPNQHWTLTGMPVEEEGASVLIDVPRLAPGSAEGVRQKLIRSMAFALVVGAGRLVAVPLGLALLWITNASGRLRLTRVSAQRGRHR